MAHINTDSRAVELFSLWYLSATKYWLRWRILLLSLKQRFRKRKYSSSSLQRPRNGLSQRENANACVTRCSDSMYKKDLNVSECLFPWPPTKSRIPIATYAVHGDVDLFGMCSHSAPMPKINYRLIQIPEWNTFSLTAISNADKAYMNVRSVSETTEMRAIAFFSIRRTYGR